MFDLYLTIKLKKKLIFELLEMNFINYQNDITIA